MLRNVVTDLIIHGQVKVTAAVAKDVVSEADRLVTLTKMQKPNANLLFAIMLC